MWGAFQITLKRALCQQGNDYMQAVYSPVPQSVLLPFGNTHQLNHIPSPDTQTFVSKMKGGDEMKDKDTEMEEVDLSRIRKTKVDKFCDKFEGTDNNKIAWNGLH